MINITMNDYPGIGAYTIRILTGISNKIWYIVDVTSTALVSLGYSSAVPIYAKVRRLLI